MNIYQITAIVLVSLFLNGCAGREWSPYPKRVIYEPRQDTDYRQSEPKRIPTPTPTPSPTIGSAGALYHKAKDYLSQGDYNQAEMTMERALRVEPRNGYYWHTLAKVKYRKKQYSQAVQFCLKSKSMAGSDRQLIQINDDLIERAKRSSGQ